MARQDSQPGHSPSLLVVLPAAHDPAPSPRVRACPASRVAHDSRMQQTLFPLGKRQGQQLDYCQLASASRRMHALSRSPCLCTQVSSRVRQLQFAHAAMAPGPRTRRHTQQVTSMDTPLPQHLLHHFGPASKPHAQRSVAAPADMPRTKQLYQTRKQALGPTDRPD